MAFYTPAIYLFNEMLRYIPLHILNPVDSVRYIIYNPISLSRYGDGELNIIMGGDIHFQRYNDELKKRLVEILKLPPEPGFKVAIPIMVNTLDNLSPSHYDFWKMNMQTGRMHWHRLCTRKMFLDSQFTWAFILEENRSDGSECLDILPQLWNNKDILIVSGGGKLGANESFLTNVKSIRRIVCPKENAFEKYKEILAAVKHYYCGQLVLISLGPTATVLAYDLHIAGIRAIDIGHIGRCYQEYYESKGIIEKMSDKDYSDQILEIIS